MALKTDQYGNVIENTTGRDYKFDASGNIDYSAPSSNYQAQQSGNPASGSTPPAGIRVDSTGAWTGAPQDPYSAPVMSDIYGGDATASSAMQYAQDKANSAIPTPEEAYQNKLKLFQSEIDATNRIYADKVKEANMQGLSRVGSSNARQARAGLLGSDFGASQDEETKKYNNEIVNSLWNENQAVVADILGKARAESAADIAEKRAAKEAGYSSYVKYLTDFEGKKKERVTNLAKSLIAQGLDIKGLKPEELNTLAKTYGVSKEEIQATYLGEKQAYDKEQASIDKAAGETDFTLSEGQQRFVLDPKTGQYVKAAGVSKTYAPKSASGGAGGAAGAAGAGGSAKYGSDLDAVIGSTLATIPTKFGQQQYSAQLKSARNDADRINVTASVVLKNQPAEIRRDFANQAVGIRNLDKAISLIDSGVSTGVVNNGLQYAFNLAGKDYDPKLASIAQYITSAIQPYRNSVTGAAWGEQEESEYQSLFGSTKYSPTELKQRLQGMKEILKDKSAQGLNTFVNPLETYANPFQTGNLAPSQAQAAATGATGATGPAAMDPLGIR